MANRVFRVSTQPQDLVADAAASVSVDTGYLVQNLTISNLFYASAASAPDADTFRGAFFLKPGEQRAIWTPKTGGLWVWTNDTSGIEIAIDEAPTSAD